MSRRFVSTSRAGAEAEVTTEPLDEDEQAALVAEFEADIKSSSVLWRWGLAGICFAVAASTALSVVQSGAHGTFAAVLYFLAAGPRGRVGYEETVLQAAAFAVPVALCIPYLGWRSGWAIRAAWCIVAAWVGLNIHRVLSAPSPQSSGATIHLVPPSAAVLLLLAQFVHRAQDSLSSSLAELRALQYKCKQA